MFDFFVVAAAWASISASVAAMTEADIQQQIDQAILAGGGEIVLPAGEIALSRGLMLKNAKQIRIRAAERGATILKMAPFAFAKSAAPAAAGAKEIDAEVLQNLSPGIRLHIESDGDIDSFTKKPKPYHLAIVAKVKGSRILLKEPLKHPVPAGCFIRDSEAPNLIEIRGASEDVLIDGITLDGGRTANDPPVRAHAQLCGIFASGPYSYENGPSGPAVKNVRVTNCTIRNCFGRGVAFYSVDESLIEDCSIANSNDEGIDFDHFTDHSIARRNRIERCNVGIEMNDASDCIVEENEFQQCNVGLNLWRWCKQPGLNENNQIRKNRFIDITGNGLQIAGGTAKNVIAANLVQNPGKAGITLAGSEQTVVDNTIVGARLKPIAINAGEHLIQNNLIK